VEMRQNFCIFISLQCTILWRVVLVTFFTDMMIRRYHSWLPVARKMFCHYSLCCPHMWSRNKINSVLATIYFISVLEMFYRHSVICIMQMTLKHFWNILATVYFISAPRVRTALAYILVQCCCFEIVRDNASFLNAHVNCRSCSLIVNCE